MLQEGQKAPDFSLYDQNGVMHHLSDYLGKKVVLYFYPKDNTPGCSLQARGFNELLLEFKKANAVVLGVSKDSLKSHEKFSSKYDLQFPILSDETLEVCNLYDVYKEKKNYGKVYMGVVRTTYIIDENGIIVKVYEKVSTKTNPQDALNDLK